jgi:YtkA-like
VARSDRSLANILLSARQGQSARQGSGARVARALIGAIILLGILSSCGRMQQADPTTRDSYVVTMVVEPSPPTVGPSTVVASLIDQTGLPADGARLQIEANMSHAGMVPVLASTTESHAGLYRVPLQWTMAGDWTVDLTFTLPDGLRVVRRYPVSVK